MTALVLVLLSAVGQGACGDRAACRFKIGDDAALAEALSSLGLVAGEVKAAALKRPGGDVSFELTWQTKGDDVVVKAVALQRTGVWAEGSARVMKVKKPEWKKRALHSALKSAIGRALDDLVLRISGVRKLKLSLQVTSLDTKAREHAEQSLLPCLKSLYSLTGPVTAPELRAGYLDEAIEYLPEKDEPREALQWQVERVREAMLGGMRSKCSIAGTPLQGWSTLVAADTLNGAVVVGFKR